MSNKLLYLFLIIGIVLLSSCQDTYQQVEFKEITNVKLGELSGTSITLSGDCVLFNPNDVALDLTNATFDVYVDGRKTAAVNQDIDVAMPANEQFIVPLKATINAKDFYGEQGSGLFRAAIQVLARQKVSIKYNGTIKAGKGWAMLPIKVLDSIEVPVKIY